MRNTSPVGWIPLLAIKVFREGALIPFIISGIFVALPILFATVWIDTIMYNSDTWVLTGYNFFEMNILHGLSKYFGEDGPFYYLIVGLPSIFVVIVPAVYLSFFSHIRLQLNLDKSPYLVYYSAFSIFFFSLIAHKEVRFLMPLISFLMLLAGELVANYTIKRWPNFTAFVIKLYIMVEIITLVVI